ncbi:hypothetical protein J5U46_22295 [Micromonospora tulbaghiae]|uniref:DUF3558 domain-containing protein n=1 Tax=Micromonospora tulbaghiae TaxID=479978 RepID=A0AAW4JM85_9ACTN|nr:hypothetical protein [Micromonospora tulbaghiae]MBO4142882.1 hypothetical protein [Micromonospora tulbaghiae]MDX5457964.1 hypothetical protein [Micromonospora tulbaghiae]SCE84819.1 hypothetical protein GA0070562_3388 [Micromonospora tulbaghiae]
MRARIWLAVPAVLLAAGCTEAPTESGPPAPPPPVPVAAASSGGACRLLDFAVIAEHTGGTFDVAAATERGDTHTCVVRAAGAVLPELTLSVTETSIDAATFALDVQPSGAAKISKLGKAAYRRTLPKTAKSGPAAEVGWLATEGRLATLRWTAPAGTAKAEAEKTAGKLVTLAKVIDTRQL